MKLSFVLSGFLCCLAAAQNALSPTSQEAAAEAAAVRKAERDRRFAEEIALVEAAGRDERENGQPAATPEPETVSTGTSSVEIPSERPERPARVRDPEY